MTGSLMFILGELMSIFALRTLLPSGNSPFFILSNKSRFSSMLLSLYGEFLPGSVRVPLYSLISSADKSHTKAFPFFISLIAASYIFSK